MSNILVVPGSFRPNSAGKDVVRLVCQLFSGSGAEVSVVSIEDINLPFFNSETIPSDPNFNPSLDNVKKWIAMVEGSDAVVLVTPEYNGSLSAIQKNAIDWMKVQWQDKPVALVGYGWHGGRRAHDNARVVLSNVEARLVSESAELTFMQDLDTTGKITNTDAVTSKLQTVVDATLNSLK